METARDWEKIEHPISYIYKVALTTALAVVKRLMREHDVITESGLLRTLLVDKEDDVSEVLTRQRILEHALNELDAREQSAVRAYLVGFNHVEVANLLAISESSARHAVYRGISRLKSVMADIESESDE